MPFARETTAQAFVADFFRARDWSFVEQYGTGQGRIDMMLLNGDAPSMGVEIKRDITDATSASVLADYLEQAAAYSKSLDVPVVLGPAMVDLGGGFTRLHTGGAKLTAIAALTIFGGRANVGVMAFDAQRRHERMCIALRGQIYYRFDSARGIDELSRPKAHRMVRTVNSNKVRA